VLGRHPAAWLLLLAALAGICFAAAAWGAAINGGPRNEVLRGTSGPDKIYGRGGNDKLYGLGGNDYLNGGPGNDMLVGGPGADRIVCGPGKDTVSADSSDTVAKDCEIVRGPKPVGKAANVVPGRYCGFTSQGMSICFTVSSDRRSFTEGHFAARIACTPGPVQEWTFDMPGKAAIGSDGSFEYKVTSVEEGSEVSESLIGSYLRGKIDSVGNAQGEMHVSKLSFTKSSTAYSCETADATWTANKQ
jgi:hypothetical protein